MVSPSDDSGDDTAALCRDIIVIGASAGGVDILLRLAAGLPPDFPASLFVVLHFPPHYHSVFPSLLSRVGPLPATHATDGEAIRKGHIYVAPPDRHLILEPGRMRLSAGPRENFVRPAADALFRSAAIAYGPRVIGIVLSGTLYDGTAGLWEIKEHGGIAVVQTVGDAPFPSMPYSAMNQVPVDYVLPVADMPALLARLVRESLASDTQRAGESLEGPVAGGNLTMAEERGISATGVAEKPAETIVERDMASQIAGERDGAITVYTCPECGGALWQTNAGPILRFRCHIGHVYTGDNLMEGYTENLERSLWYAVRTLRDKANLTRQLANDARLSGDTDLLARYDERVRIDEEHADNIEMILSAATSVDRGE